MQRLSKTSGEIQEFRGFRPTSSRSLRALRHRSHWAPGRRTPISVASGRWRRNSAIPSTALVAWSTMSTSGAHEWLAGGDGVAGAERVAVHGADWHHALGNRLATNQRPNAVSGVDGTGSPDGPNGWLNIAGLRSSARHIRNARPQHGAWPKFVQFDMSLLKGSNLTASQRLGFRVEVFNILNTVIWAASPRACSSRLRRSETSRTHVRAHRVIWDRAADPAGGPLLVLRRDWPAYRAACHVPSNPICCEAQPCKGSGRAPGGRGKPCRPRWKFLRGREPCVTRDSEVALCASPATVLRRFDRPVPAGGPFARRFRVRLASSSASG